MKSSIVRELRAVQRYSVSLPVCVTFRAMDASHPPIDAMTRDISTRGMFVIADAEPVHGDLLEFEIDMSVDHDEPLVVVQGAGRVVRTEGSSEPGRAAGFAVHNLWFKLREPEQGQALPLGLQALGLSNTTSPAGRGGAADRRGLTVVPRQVTADTDPESDRKESK